MGQLEARWLLDGTSSGTYFELLTIKLVNKMMLGQTKKMFSAHSKRFFSKKYFMVNYEYVEDAYYKRSKQR